MTDYWVSNKTYYCKYCNIYITDNKPSRQHHENGMKHRGNVERSLKNLYKQGTKEKDEAKRIADELAKIERKAIRANAPTKGPLMKIPTSKILPTKSGKIDPTKYSQPGLPSNEELEALYGVVDEDESTTSAEAAIGEWQVVETPSQTNGLGDGEQMDEAEEKHHGFKIREKTFDAVVENQQYQDLDEPVTFRKRRKFEKSGSRKVKKEE